MTQGGSGVPGWFVKVLNKVIKALFHVKTYLNNVIVPHLYPASHSYTIRELLLRLRQHHVKLSTAKSRLGASEAAFLGPTITPFGVKPNAESSPLWQTRQRRVTQSNKVPPGWFILLPNCWPNLAKRVRPLNQPCQQALNFAFTPMETVVRDLLTKLSVPDWDVAADGARPFLLFCNACIDVVWCYPQSTQGGWCCASAAIYPPRHAEPGMSLDLTRP